MDKVNRRNRYIETGDVFVEKLKSKNFLTILDLGCGENLYKDVNGVVGIDVDQTHADVKANIVNLPYPDASIDCVLAFGSLVYGDRPEFEHLDPIKLLDAQLREINRVLKSEGSFYGRTHYLEILNTSTIDKYAKRYGFEQVDVKMIFRNSEERLYWEWVKI